ncbi:Origin recognition complex, subunit 1 [Coemansia javaensis]|uniref:Origin recognition complex subunit 1 n=1 Tax=Coemansia javaensis TaxID=2761396 RepID=A0A9W8HFQ5_9FUNG|nr:Origin recognition complex, subunit 1 [Coemansia javaensis]
MALSSRQSKLASRLSKAARQPPAAKRQRSGNGSDSDSEPATVEWGQRLDGTSGDRADSPAPPRLQRRVTRGSGMTNKELYRSVVVGGTEYWLGQAVRVRSPGETPYFAIVFKLWENELGVRQVVARWLLRHSEMLPSRRATPLEGPADPAEVFYSNADDLVTPDMILGPLTVVSHAAYLANHRHDAAAAAAATQQRQRTDPSVYFCRRFFNENTAMVGDLDWEALYGSEQMLDPVADAALFKAPPKKAPLGRKAATAAARARAAPRKPTAAPAAAAAPATPRGKRQRADTSEDEPSDGDAEYNSGGSDDEEKPASRTPARARRAASVRAPRTPATASKRRVRLRDIQPAAVSTAVLKRASRASGAGAPSAAGQSIYEAARSRLHVSAVPNALPCREDEFAEIYGHLYSAVEERTSMCMYISGVPGTGKTATVHEVIRALQESAEEGEVPVFQYIELNGMKMTEPAQAYSQLWQAISGDKATPKHAAQLLERHFGTPSPRRHTYVVLVDELDLLVTKSQSIMYNFFDWPHRPHAKLVVVAIANTMDLPERMLHHKVSSRLGLARINFQPYSHQQLMAIVQSRLEGCAAFDPDAIELCARKISAVSGDARRALDVCRRAVEVVEAEWLRAPKRATGKKQPQQQQQQQPLVTMMVIDRAIKEMYASGHIAFIQSASRQQKVFLVALRAAVRKAGVPEVSLGDVAFIHRQLCQMHDLALPSHDQIAKICAQLGASRCILAESSILDVHQQVRLAVAEDDITVALRPDPLFSKIATS